MKNFIATFWRGNPQIENGGYETTRTIEARTIASARKKAEKIENNCAYGTMSLLMVQPEAAVLECKKNGHKLIASNADAENGTEDLYCERCGFTHTAKF